MGRTCPRYFQVSWMTGHDRLEAAAGQVRGRAALDAGTTGAAGTIASMPSEPGCTGSWKKCALKNHSPGSTSFSRAQPAKPGLRRPRARSR